jgi:hypothetical protein
MLRAEFLHEEKHIMTNPPLDEPQQRDNPTPSLQGLYGDPDGTHETGRNDDTQATPLPETGIKQHALRDPADEDAYPATTMDSNEESQRRADLLEPAAQHPHQQVGGTPQASESDSLAEQPIRSTIQPND